MDWYCIADSIIFTLLQELKGNLFTLFGWSALFTIIRKKILWYSFLLLVSSSLSALFLPEHIHTHFPWLSGSLFDPIVDYVQCLWHSMPVPVHRGKYIKGPEIGSNMTFLGQKSNHQLIPRSIFAAEHVSRSYVRTNECSNIHLLSMSHVLSNSSCL